MTEFGSKPGPFEEQSDGPGIVDGTAAARGGFLDNVYSVTGQPFETMSFLPDAEAAPRAISAEDCEAALQLARGAVHDVLSMHDNTFYADFAGGLKDELTRLALPESDSGYQIAELERLISMTTDDQAAALTRFRDGYAQELARAVELERADVEMLNNESAQYRADLLATADWSAIFDRRYPTERLTRSEEWLVAGRYQHIQSALSYLSPHTELPPNVSMAVLVHEKLREIHQAVRAYGDVLPEGTVWQPPDADWTPTPGFGEEAMDWKNDVNLVVPMVAGPRRNFMHDSKDFTRLCDMAHIAHRTRMGMDGSGDDGVPIQLQYEVERRYAMAKERFMAADAAFIREHTVATPKNVAVHDPYGLAHHNNVYAPELWAQLQLRWLPRTMTRGIRSVKFDKKENARTWVYKGETQRAAASYNDEEQSITFYVDVDPDQKTQLLANGWSALEAFERISDTSRIRMAHEAMHHVHTWRATFDQLVRFMRRARQDDPAHVSDYVAEAYTPETGLNGDLERFAETGSMYYFKQAELRAVGSGNHYEAFKEFEQDFI